MKRRDLLSAVAGALVATALAGGIAWAAIPGAGGVINRFRRVAETPFNHIFEARP